MRIANRCATMVVALAAAVTLGCSNATGPVHADLLQGRWEGTNVAGVSYVYVFEAQESESTNPRTGNVARTYSLSYTTTPGGSGSVTAWSENNEAYWGGSSLGTFVDDSTMTVQADGVAPFIMRRK